MQTFNTILELCEKLSTKAKYIEFCINIRWKDGVECPHCNYKKVYTLSGIDKLRIMIN